jgi:hypothetical protein
VYSSRCDVLRVREKKRTYGFLRAHHWHLEATRPSLFIATAEWLTSYSSAAYTTPVPIYYRDSAQHHPTIKRFSIMSSREPMWYCYEVSSTLHQASSNSSAYRSSQCHAEMRPLMVCRVSSSLLIPEKYQALQMTTLFRSPIPIVHHVMAPSWSRYGTMACLTPG